MVNVNRVDLARRRLGLTKAELAGRLGIDRRTLQRFESGEFPLSSEVVERLEHATGFPVSFFYKGEFDYPNAASVSFRSLRSLTAGRRNSAIAAASIAFEFDDWISDRYDRPSHDLPQLESASPAIAAAHLRALWGIGERPVDNLMDLIESHGVRVFSLSEESRHLDAYSLWRDDQPYIFLNNMKTAEHSRFDAAHELGHLVMHRHTGSGHSTGEAEANTFASAFLMPRGDLLAECNGAIDFWRMVEKKKRWGVSVAALNYALFKAGRISEWTYRGIYIELGKRGRADEPAPMMREKSQVWTKILTDLWRQGISLSKVAEALAVPVQELNDILFNIASQSQPGPSQSLGKLRVV